MSPLLFLLACNDFSITENVGQVLDTKIVIDSGESQAQALDVLLLVDRSGSMVSEHNMLAKQLPDFLSHLSGSDFDNLDWQVGISSTNPADLGAYGWVGRDDYQPQDQLDSLLNKLYPNCSGKTCEQGFDAVLTSIVYDSEHRADADLLVIWVSDENDESANTVESYLSQAQGFRAAPFATRHVAIVYTYDDSPCGKKDKYFEPGTGYIEAADTVLSLCQPETWIQSLDVAAEHLWEMNTRWFLSQTPADVFGIKVLWGDTEFDDWHYNGLVNAVDLDYTPDPGIKITIIYQALL